MRTGKGSIRFFIVVLAICGILAGAAGHCLAQEQAGRANLYRDQRGAALQGAIPQSPYIDAIVLSPSVSQQIAIPSGYNLVIFSVSGGADFYMLFSGSAIAVPTGNITDGSAPELRPDARSIGAGQTSISLVSPVTCVVTMAFYK